MRVFRPRNRGAAATVRVCPKTRFSVRLAVPASTRIRSGPSHTVWPEGEHVAGSEHRGEVPLAVPDAAFEVGAVGFQDVEALGLDPPSRPGAGHDVGDAVPGEVERGPEGILVSGLAPGAHDGDADPVAGPPERGDAVEGRPGMGRLHRVQHRPDVVVGRDRPMPNSVRQCDVSRPTSNPPCEPV